MEKLLFTDSLGVQGLDDTGVKLLALFTLALLLKLPGPLAFPPTFVLMVSNEFTLVELPNLNLLNNDEVISKKENSSFSSLLTLKSLILVPAHMFGFSNPVSNVNAAGLFELIDLVLPS